MKTKTCRQKRVKKTEESERVGHLSHFLIFCEVKLPMKNVVGFAPDGNISQRRTAIYGMSLHYSHMVCGLNMHFRFVCPFTNIFCQYSTTHTINLTRDSLVPIFVEYKFNNNQLCVESEAPGNESSHHLLKRYV